MSTPIQYHPIPVLPANWHHRDMIHYSPLNLFIWLCPLKAAAFIPDEPVQDAIPSQPVQAASFLLDQMFVTYSAEV